MHTAISRIKGGTAVSSLLAVTLSATLILSLSASRLHAQRDPAELVFGIIGLAIAAEQAKRKLDSATAAEQSRISQQAAAERALIRRAQSALSKLGFYKLAIDGVSGPGTEAALRSYAAAFSIRQFSFSEADIAVLERHANSGFASAEDARRARAGGFSNQEDYAAAQAAGYTTFREFQLGVAAGARDAREFRAFATSGFESLPQFRAAVEQGFTKRAEFERARAKGFDTAADFRRFVASGHPDRETFLAAEARAAAARANRSECLGTGEPSALALACANTLLVDPSDRTALAAYGRLLPQLESAFALAERDLSDAREAAKSTAGDTSTPAPAALARIAEAENARDTSHARLALAQCVVSSTRMTATADLTALKGLCRAAADRNPDMEGLIALMVRIEALQSERLAAIEAEQARLALEEGRDDAADLLARITQFNQSGGRFAHGLDVARAVVSLRDALEADEADAVVRALEAANARLENEVEFAAFIAQSAQAELDARARAVETARTELRRYAMFLEEHVAANLLDKRTPDYLALLETVHNLLRQGGPDSVVSGRAEVERDLRRYGLLDRAEAFEIDREATAERLADASLARIATDRVTMDARFFLEDIRAFSQAGNVFTNPLETAKAVNAVMQAVEAGDQDSLERAFASATAALGANPGFVVFRAERDAIRDAAMSDALAIARARAEAVNTFIVAQLARDPLNENLVLLLEVQGELETVIASGDPEAIAGVQEAAVSTLSDAGLADGVQAAIRGAEVASDTSDVMRTGNGLAVSAMNRDLLEGDLNDILILENRTASAPYASRNLRGDLVFAQGEAKICWAHEPPATTDLGSRLAIDSLRGFGASRTSAAIRCDPEDILGVDLVLMRRGAFLLEDANYASVFVDAHETARLQILETIAWGSVAARIAAMKTVSEHIEDELGAGLRAGVGYVSLEKPGNLLCAVEGPESNARVLEAHRRLHARDVALYLPAHSAIVAEDKERIFERARNADCASIQADAASMTEILDALRRERIAYAVAPFWASVDELNAIKAALAETDAERARRLARLAQEIEADRAQREAVMAQTEQVRLARQAELRAQYGQEARAALNGLKALIAPTFDPESPRTSPQVRTLFPEVAAWAEQLASGLWEYETHRVELRDFGTATWQDRRLEAVVAEVFVSVFNRSRGERATRCFLLGYLMDAEFERLRDPLMSDCAGGENNVDVWMTGRFFETRWTAR